MREFHRQNINIILQLYKFIKTILKKADPLSHHSHRLKQHMLISSFLPISQKLTNIILSVLKAETPTENPIIESMND